MAEHPLSPDERALWSRVTEGVSPLRGRRSLKSGLRAEAAELVAGPKQVCSLSPPAAPPKVRPRPIGQETLDGGWDRRLLRGAVLPEMTIDLHGHTLASAHAALDHALERAIVSEVRIVLLVTGRPPRSDGRGDTRRGLIRASIHDWLAGSRHASRIAAVRGAHPRHGGAGALYLILRRMRG